MGHELEVPRQRREVRPGAVLREQPGDGRDEVGQRDGGPDGDRSRVGGRVNHQKLRDDREVDEYRRVILRPRRRELGIDSVGLHA